MPFASHEGRGWPRPVRALVVARAVNQLGAFALPFLAVFSLHSLTESIALSQNDLIWMMFSATAVKLSAPALGRRQSEVLSQARRR